MIHEPRPRRPSMASAEFELIAAHLTGLGAAREDVVLGVGDDAALVRAPAGAVLRAATSSVRPRRGEEPEALVARAIRPALRALEEAGAQPAWATLALTLAPRDAGRLDALGPALDRAAREAGVAIVGGDTTCGPTRLTITAIGTAAR